MATSSAPTESHAPSKGPLLGMMAGLVAAIAGFMYAFDFLVRKDLAMSSFWLMVGGIASSGALVVLATRVQSTDSAVAMWGLLLGVIGSLGAAVHGGFDLANTINVPGGLNADVPNAVDPRGLLTFGVSGLGLLALMHVTYRTPGLPKGLAWLGTVVGILSLVLYVGRLTILTPASPVLAYPALANGFVLNPLFYFWLGLTLRK